MRGNAVQNRKTVATKSPRQKTARWNELKGSYLKVHVERISTHNRQRHHKPWPKRGNTILGRSRRKTPVKLTQGQCNGCSKQPICSDKGQANTIFRTHYRPFITWVLKRRRHKQITNTQEPNGTVGKTRIQRRKRFQSPTVRKFKAVSGW